MYGCADGYVIFGFKENEGDRYICWDFLEKYQIMSFHSEVVKCHAGEFIYGLRCNLNKHTGQASIKDEKKAIVEAAYHAACKVNGDSNFSGLGYFIAVTMDDTELCHTEYDPRKNSTNKFSKVDTHSDDDESEDFAIETRTQQAARSRKAASSNTATVSATTDTESKTHSITKRKAAAKVASVAPHVGAKKARK